MAASTAPMSAQTPALKTHFKTPEGRYKLQYEKTHPFVVLNVSQGKTVSRLTIAYLKEKPANQTSAGPLTSSSGELRSATSRLWGGSSSNSKINAAGVNGVKVLPGNGKVGGSVGQSTGSSSLHSVSNYDGKGTYLIFNAGDTIFISDLNSQDKDPIKSLHFSNSNPVCHAFSTGTDDGHDLLIGLQSGDVYSVSLRQQLQDAGRKLVASHHYNKDGTISSSKCTCITWIPGREGTFLVGHSDGNIYLYEKGKDGTVDCSFPAVRDQTQFGVTHARSSKCSPIARWHISQGSVNSISFSTDAVYMATVSRDGYLRVFDYAKEQLIFGGKSYYGALLCCAWSPDGKYILTGGEDDLVQTWSMDEKKIVAWGEGHNSWVSGVAFDSYWTEPGSEGTGESLMYRFGSVGQDTQILLWDFVLDEIAFPLRGPLDGSPTLRNGNYSAHWDNAYQMGTLQPSPSMRDVPKLSPLVAHRAYTDPLSGLIFTHAAVITISRDGHIKIWARPGHGESNQPGTSESLSVFTSLRDISAAKSNVVNFKQASSVLFA